MVGVLLAGLLVACTADVPTLSIEAQPSPEVTSKSPSPSLSPSPTPSPSASPSPSPSPTEEVDRVATATDRARFVASFQPDGATNLEHVAADVDGDGAEEVLFAYVRGGRVAHLEVAWWTGTAYEIGFATDGAPATDIDRLRARDINADNRIEVLVGQTGEDDHASISIWQVVAPGEVVPLPAAGGCHDGSHTYGVTGVSFDDRDADGVDEIYATCADGDTHRYRWEAGVYRHAPQLLP